MVKDIDKKLVKLQEDIAKKKRFMSLLEDLNLQKEDLEDKVRTLDKIRMKEENDVEKIDGKSVFDAADNGDSVAQAVIDQYCQYLAIGISNIVNALAPEMILVGGGISRQGDRILAPVRKYVSENCFDKRPEALPEIMPAQMGNEAGIVGAAALI